MGHETYPALQAFPNREGTPEMPHEFGGMEQIAEEDYVVLRI